MKQLPAGTWFRLVCVLLLWIALVYIIIAYSTRIDFFTLFAIAASGVVVFVPLYKKHFGNGKGNGNGK